MRNSLLQNWANNNKMENSQCHHRIVKCHHQTWNGVTNLGNREELGVEWGSALEATNVCLPACLS